MYLVSGYDSIGDSLISAMLSGRRRHAIGFLDPLRYAFSATLARVGSVMPWSCM